MASTTAEDAAEDAAVGREAGATVLPPLFTGPLLSVRTVSDDEVLEDECDAELAPLLTSLDGTRMAGGRTTRPLGGGAAGLGRSDGLSSVRSGRPCSEDP